jgi:hypothetical protein
LVGDEGAVVNSVIPDDPNPTGVTTFDHHGLAVLPEYWAASRALHDLRVAALAAGLDMPWEEWLAVVHAIVAAPFFVDVCPRCLGSRVPPGAAVVRGDRLEGSYVCVGCGYGWVSEWVTWAPAVLGVDPEGEASFDIPAPAERGDAA